MKAAPFFIFFSAVACKRAVLSQALSRGQTTSSSPLSPPSETSLSDTRIRAKEKEKNGASVGRRPAAGCSAAVDDAFDVVVGSSSRSCSCSCSCSSPTPCRPSRHGRHVLQGRWRRHRRRERARAPHPEAQPVHRGLLRHGSLW